MAAITGKRIVTLIVAVSLGGCSGHSGSAPSGSSKVTRYGEVSEARLLAADREPDQWFTPGRDVAGSYYSPLGTINKTNMQRLGFAWDYMLGTSRGLEATPVVVDGVMYTSGNWGRVYALDAASGRELWTYDPGAPGQWGRFACCDVVNRGVAVLAGRVYVASVDGYLHAIDARTGQRLWRTDTLPGRGPKDFHYASTGAPLIAGDLIVIGNGGADFAGARGMVSAYDLRTGAFRWRFYTVPRDPHLGPQDQPHLEAAIRTWDPKYDWNFGGGGTVWDGMAYDPALQLIYIGTGNGAPYGVVDSEHRKYSDLYVASIVAIHASSGQLAWYFQEIPGEGWDYDTTAKLVLAELTIASQPRQVLMQASKNGFLYVLDRETGAVLSSPPFAYVNWTQGLDPKTHQPIVGPQGDWMHQPRLLYPGAAGAHTWQPMSYSPKTGLLYIPVIDAPMVYINTADRRAGLMEGAFDLAFFYPEEYDPKTLGGLLGALPPLEALAKGVTRPVRSRNVLRAIDPMSGKVAWEQETQNPSDQDGGALSTAGGLVFRGDVTGFLSVYDADSGRLLNRVDVGTPIMAAPMTYRINGEQYVAFMAGFGGADLSKPLPKENAAYKYGNAGRIVALKLGGGAVPRPPAIVEAPPPGPPAREGTTAEIGQGEVLYNRFCARCHVFGRGLLPDLRHMSPQTQSIFYDIVLNGLYQAKGMPRWDDALTRTDAQAIHAYLVDEAWKANAAQTAH